MPKSKKKRKWEENPPPDEDAPSSSSDGEEETPTYETFRAPNYSRKYDLSNNLSEYVVFLSYRDPQLSISEKTRLIISQGIKKYEIKGIKHLRSINKYKVGIVFDAANSANVFLDNTKFFNDTELTSSIPAGATEVTGVVRDVPISYSNKRIFSTINSLKNVVQVKRFMRKDTENSSNLIPTKTIAITFASTQLPQHVYLDNWRHEVSTYVPPVKQCLKCLRFGHIAKFCKNSIKCSICTEDHSFKVCMVNSKDAKCINCGGNHLAISSSCPIKKQKVHEQKVKAQTFSYSDLVKDNSFPPLNPKMTIQNLLTSDQFINLLVQSVVKLVTDKTSINSNNVKKLLVDTFKDFKN